MLSSNFEIRWEENVKPLDESPFFRSKIWKNYVFVDERISTTRRPSFYEIIRKKTGIPKILLRFSTNFLRKSTIFLQKTVENSRSWIIKKNTVLAHTAFHRMHYDPRR